MSKPSSLEALVDLVAALRGEGGCPWDKKQTPQSMRVYLLEEMHELVEAIDSDDDSAVMEELGDVLFQVVFLSRIFQERNQFGLDRVASRVTEKMIARHPHVFGDEKARTAGEVRERWHQYKKSEGKKRENPLDAVPKSLPALLRAYRVCERAFREGFDPLDGKSPEAFLEDSWEVFSGAWNQCEKQDKSKAVGDLLFGLARACYADGVHPDTALSRAVDAFAAEFGNHNGKDKP